MPVLSRDVDLVAYTRQGDPLLLVEVKGGRQEWSARWAAEFRRNILSHDTLPKAPYFLIATPDRMYFWGEEHISEPESTPDFITGGDGELKPFFDKAQVNPATVGNQTMQLVVFAWLNEISELGVDRVKEPALATWLSESGLLQRMHYAQIEISTAR